MGRGPVLLALLAGLSCRAAPAPIETFTFLEINDLHVTDEASLAYPARVIEALNRENAAFVLVCGDVATDGREGELRLARGLLDRLKAPFHVVPGNHDAMFEGERPEEAFRAAFGVRETTYAFEFCGVHFVAIDPGCGKAYARNTVRPAVLDRLRSIAAGIPEGAPLVLFSHYPYGPGVTYRTPNAKDVLDIFKHQRLLAVVSGHWHGNTERREGGVLFTTTACASGTRKNHDGTAARGYRVFTVRGGSEVSTEFREVPPQ
jgi:calcineurin-like phosphoesterase family protein